MQRFPYRFVLLNDDLRARLLSGNDDNLRERALARLYGPLAGSGKLIEDPFGLYLGQQLQPGPGLRLSVSDSMLELVDSPLPSYLLVLTLAGDPFSPAMQASLLAAIESQRQQFAGVVDEVAMSGMLLHAAAGAGTAR